MSQFDFRETTTEEWNRIILELLERVNEMNQNFKMVQVQ